ncbi:Flp pilus assembly complex ATPase component TadA [Bacillus thuringiensis]|uniref:Flp pilus assembly complex ATPase component TadA n=1 Tax=Bacillus thuringiensis TaxID=1428 RepID=UPI000BFCCBA1|nr:Flp pilus assembly complex ATPase component TadA [Bacillus thuringiensis]PGT89818.1 hypothetical protein COD17_08705 [Bacillus thuringiensis]
MTVSEHRNEDKLNVVADYVKDGKTVVIIGTCGSGKTTLLKELLNYTGDDKVLAIGWSEDLKGINRSNVTVKDRHDDGLNDDMVQLLASDGAHRLAYDEVRGESFVPVLHAWKETGKGLGTVIANSVGMLLHQVFDKYIDVTKKTVQEAGDCFIQAVDVIVEMNPRSRDIETVFEVDKEETSAVKVKRIIG